MIPMGCANPVGTLTGGLKDEIPPKIIPSKSTPNPSLNFKEKEIVLTFDEWVKLEDAFNQVVVSPPLDERLDIKLKGKTVKIKIAETDTLKENTTYIINMGNSVKDLTEGNIPPNLKFVFSTGNEIDSLSIKGQVFDLESGKGAADVLVMLYKNLADSIVRVEKPYYFGKTDKEGNFKIEYLKTGTYKAFALVDNNFNYIFDLPNEKIGFMENAINVTDSSNISLSFKMFEEEPPLLIIDQELRQQGVAKLIFNKKPDDVKIDVSDAFAEDRYFIDFSKDTILIWYTETDSSLQRTIRLSLEKEAFNDTLDFKIPIKKKELSFGKVSKSTKISLSPVDSFEIEFSLPIAEIDTSQIIIKQDSLDYIGKKNISITKNPRKIRIDLERSENKVYEISILPNAIKDIFGHSTDSLGFKIEALPLKEFGDINLNVVFPDSTIQYIVSLLDGDGNERAEFMANNVSSIKKTFKTLPSGTYQIKVI